VALLDQGQHDRSGDRVRLSAQPGNFLLEMRFSPQVRGVAEGRFEEAAGIGKSIGANAAEAGDDSPAEFTVWFGAHGENFAHILRKFKSALKLL
jgi:hypothetical protein